MASVVPTPSLLRSSFRRTLNKFRLQQEQESDDDEDEDDQENRPSSPSAGHSKYSAKERQDMNLSYLQSLPPNSLVVLQDNDSTWRSVFVQMLERCLSPAHVKGIQDGIDVGNVIFNMTHVSPKGVVQIKNTDKVV